MILLQSCERMEITLAIAEWRWRGPRAGTGVRGGTRAGARTRWRRSVQAGATAAAAMVAVVVKETKATTAAAMAAAAEAKAAAEAPADVEPRTLTGSEDEDEGQQATCVHCNSTCSILHVRARTVQALKQLVCALHQLSLDLSQYGCTVLGFCCHPPALLCVTLWQWWVTTFHCNISCNRECFWGAFRLTHPP